ncbi:hypothetical protein QBC35DRAFT_498878 [Podospora australis]|uniref:Uncharacterized protein n=1 Tax=Podospora australis TaxID=1536484 RepID=A0AAN6WWB6_9PEZI|nr:hypothetical protein QBC35DRAFT_498878 [Podospora australis]
MCPCDITTAMAFLRWQFHRKHFRKHHTLPSLVFSFQHDKYCRITQFHFKRQRLILRPSRRLNLATNEPTDEAYHILRWLMTNPVGDTALREQPKEEEEEKELDWNLDHDPASFPLKVQG